MRKWTILAVGTFAQAATCCFLYGVPMLVPALRGEGVSLVGASVLVSAPMAGLLLGLIPWGAAADRYGERSVIVLGVGLASVVLFAAAAAPGLVLLGTLTAVAGGLAASVNAASGRVVMGWFPASQRGLAMGVRQTAQPVGVGLAALGLPALARAHGVHAALAYPAALCLVAALLVAVLVVDPPRPPRVAGAAPSDSPYRGSRRLARIHAASSCLVVPQFAVATFTLVYLVAQRHWDPAVAGRMIFGFQVAGALGRVASGVWSDRVGSRLVPMRQLAVASAAVMTAIAVGAALHAWFVVAAFAIGAVVTVADNGLAYTAVAEAAGPEWSGRALGVQNTAQNLTAIATAPALAAMIAAVGYPPAFVLVAAVALLAVPVTPVPRSSGEQPHRGVAAQLEAGRAGRG
jgi:sugar phosphate permease